MYLLSLLIYFYFIILNIADVTNAVINANIKLLRWLLPRHMYVKFNNTIITGINNIQLNPLSKNVLITAESVPVIINNDIIKKKIILNAFHLVIIYTWLCFNIIISIIFDFSITVIPLFLIVSYYAVPFLYIHLSSAVLILINYIPAYCY